MPATVRAWETGTLPLYRVTYNQLTELASQLAEAGAQTSAALSDLLLASQCDLLLTGLLAGFEDYAEVPPIDQQIAGEAARTLLRWALSGDVPEQYRRHAPAGQLLAAPDIDRLQLLARDLASGARGPELASFGLALASVAGHQRTRNPSRFPGIRRTQSRNSQEGQ